MPYTQDFSLVVMDIELPMHGKNLLGSIALSSLPLGSRQSSWADPVIVRPLQSCCCMQSAESRCANVTMAPSSIISTTTTTAIEASRSSVLSTHEQVAPSLCAAAGPTTSAPPPQLSSRLLLRDALIQLNNIAIEILYRYERCRPCIDIYKDALTLMKHQLTQNHDLILDRAIYEATTRTDVRYEQLADETQQSASSTTESVATDASSVPTANGLGMVVLPSSYDAEQAYHLLATIRTSKVCLTMDPNDSTIDLALVRSIVVYNYGIAHRCCSAAAAATTTSSPVQNATAVAARPENGNSDSDHHANHPNNNRNNSKNNLLESFCLQIFQYAETLLPQENHARPSLYHDDNNNNSDHNKTSTSSDHMLLFRLVLTRNLMMLSCRLGLSLCEHYKETLDPIVSDILGPLGSGCNDGNNDSQAPPGASAA